MKKYFSILCATLLLGACAKELAKDVQIEPVANNGVRFAAAFTKVSTEDGVSTWDANDNISVFSVVNGADPGVSASTNIEYVTSEGGASVTFLPVGDAASAGDKYYAFYKYSPNYPSAYNADTEIGFPGANANASVTDYRFIPVYINSSATLTFDTETGEVISGVTSFFYAKGVPSASEDDPVLLQFKPILPLLEIDLYGYGEFKSLLLSFKDKNTDVLGPKNWLTAKGVFDISTGVHTVTNSSSSAFFKYTLNLREGENTYVTLQGDKPIKIKVPVGFFTLTKGLTLTLTAKDGSTVVKDIWTDRIVCNYNEDYSPKHLRQGIKLAYVNASVASVAEFPTEGGNSEAFTVTTNASWAVKSKPDWITVSPESATDGPTSVVLTASANEGAYREGQVVFGVPNGPECAVAVSQAKFEVPSAGYYSVDLSAATFAESYIYDVKNADDKIIAQITREYLGATKDEQLVVAYHLNAQDKIDYTDGLVIANGGSVNAWTMDKDAVTYLPGDSSPLTTIWVADDGSVILTAQPAGSISAAYVTPCQLASPTGQKHAIVKIGSQIWTAEGYKTTKLANGTDIAQQTTAPYATSSNPSVIISDDKYLYNAHAVKANFAPEGWALPSVSQWSTDLASFLGSTTMYANLSMSKAQLYSRNTWKLNGTAIADLGYYNDWSNAASSSRWTMLMVKPDAAPTTSAQNMTAMFEVRLIKQ